MQYYFDSGTIPIYRELINIETSNFVGDLAIKLGKVSINKSALNQLMKYGCLIGNNSVFNEIEWINPYPDIKHNTEKYQINKYSTSLNYWSDLFIDYYYTWAKNTFNNTNSAFWVLHSSGGDSRILSGIIAKLRDRENINPNIKFVTWYPEANQAERILKFLGFANKQIWKVGDERINQIKSENYWDSSNYYDFENMGYLTNGEIAPFGSLQSNFWKPYYSDVNNINMVMAMIGDMIMGGRYWITWARKFYKGQIIPNYSLNQKWNIIIASSARYNGLGLLGYKKYFKNLLTPTMDFFPTKVGVEIPIYCRLNDNVRRTIQERLYPGLSLFKNMHGSWYNISSYTREKIEKDYFKTIFYKDFNIHYSKKKSGAILSFASLYDFLIRRGVRIMH